MVDFDCVVSTQLKGNGWFGFCRHSMWSVRGEEKKCEVLSRRLKNNENKWYYSPFLHFYHKSVQLARHGDKKKSFSKKNRGNAQLCTVSYPMSDDTKCERHRHQNLAQKKKNVHTKILGYIFSSFFFRATFSFLFFLLFVLFCLSSLYLSGVA